MAFNLGNWSLICRVRRKRWCSASVEYSDKLTTGNSHPSLVCTHTLQFNEEFYTLEEWEGRGEEGRGEGEGREGEGREGEGRKGEGRKGEGRKGEGREGEQERREEDIVPAVSCSAVIHSPQ